MFAHSAYIILYFPHLYWRQCTFKLHLADFTVRCCAVYYCEVLLCLLLKVSAQSIAMRCCAVYCEEVLCSLLRGGASQSISIRFCSLLRGGAAVYYEDVLESYGGVVYYDEVLVCAMGRWRLLWGGDGLCLVEVRSITRMCWSLAWGAAVYYEEVLECVMGMCCRNSLTVKACRHKRNSRCSNILQVYIYIIWISCFNKKIIISLMLRRKAEKILN